MSLANDCLYHGEHAWVKKAEGDEVIVGVSDFAQDTLGDIVDVSLPFVGSTITIGAPFGTLESRKTVSDLIAPISGVVIEVNNALMSEPTLVNDDPHGKGWIVRIKISNPDELELLMDVDSYKDAVGA
ncbi:glycine cleavage system protein GcvH [Methylophilus sp. 14]|uniref:glycine cleavage system protein GcvH n=1 Tax=Methylophilus sp. 14 TaxID=2781019 RepID=UPI00188F4382|nr:glycine cleavage system protein GcvH [Methylophilus sp. 14]MBF4988171.1 glycine cleavage system protein GcvH [Methylophilus sp. 14]